MHTDSIVFGVVFGFSIVPLEWLVLRGRQPISFLAELVVWLLSALAGVVIADATGVVSYVFTLTLQIASAWVVAAALLWLWTAAAARYRNKAAR